jgi:hypothetical protein
MSRGKDSTTSVESMTDRRDRDARVTLRSTLSIQAVLVFALVGFACGTSATKSGNPQAKGGASVRCASGTPVRADLLRDSLRRHGFSARCQGIPGAEVANFGPTSQGVEKDRADREGSLICEVRRHPIGRMKRHPNKVFQYNSLPTHSQPGRELYLANVDCSLYLNSPTRREATQQLRAAFDGLAKALAAKDTTN